MPHTLARHLPAFLAKRPGLALFALAATATSGFGQTFFISIMGGEIRQAFDLSHTVYGSLYSGATLCSALLLLRLGPLVDSWALPRVTILALAILGAGCLLIGTAPGMILLGMGFVCIRLGGQGMMSHIGMTTAARYFSTQRGRAVALAAAGFPLAEAVLPASAAVLLGWMNWRLPWISAAFFLGLLALPLLIFLARNAPRPEDGGQDAEGGRARQFNRREVLHDPGFYLILPATLTTPFTLTAIFFHQAAFAAQRGWSLSLLAGAFSVYAASHLCALAAAGPLVDRLGAGRALPLALTPMILGLLVLAFVPGTLVAPLYLGLVGMSQGLAATAGGAIWAERYGIRHLGAIRSMNQAIMVVSTAIAPILLGYFLDQAVSISTLALALAASAAAAALLARIGGR